MPEVRDTIGLSLFAAANVPARLARVRGVWVAIVPCGHRKPGVACGAVKKGLVHHSPVAGG